MWYCLKIFVIWRRVPFQTVNFLKAPAKWHTSFWHSLPKHRWWFFFSLGQWRLHRLHLAIKCINAQELTGSPRAQLYSWSLPRSQHLVSQTFSILTSLLSPRRHGQHKMTFNISTEKPNTYLGVDTAKTESYFSSSLKPAGDKISHLQYRSSSSTYPGEKILWHLCYVSFSHTSCPIYRMSPQLLLRTQYVQRKYPLPLPLRELHGSLTFEWKYTAFIAREVRVSAEKPKNWTSDQSTSKSVFAAVRVQGMWT